MSAASDRASESGASAPRIPAPRFLHYESRAHADRFRFLTLALITGLLVFGSARDLRAQDDPLGGGAFELGAVVGGGFFEGKTLLSSCGWFGARVGHRFAPFSGIERLQLGFRAGWEGCVTEHSETGQVDLIYVNATLLLGIRVSRSWLVYWGAGTGMLLADSTPGSGDEVDPRPSAHVGPGVTWAMGKHFLLDVSLFAVIFEGFELGSSPQGESAFGLVPNVMFALQI